MMTAGYEFQGATHVVCPSCAGQAILSGEVGHLICTSCGHSDAPSGKDGPRPRLPVRCPGCGDQIRPQAHKYQARCHACRIDIEIRETPSWDSDPVQYWAETSTRHGAIWALNPEHLSAMRDYILSDRHHPFDPESGTHRLPNRDWRSRLPKWMKLAKNRKEVMRALDRLEARFAEKN